MLVYIKSIESKLLYLYTLYIIKINDYFMNEFKIKSSDDYEKFMKEHKKLVEYVEYLANKLNKLYDKVNKVNNKNNI